MPLYKFTTRYIWFSRIKFQSYSLQTCQPFLGMIWVLPHLWEYFPGKNKSLDELLSLHLQEILAQVSSASLFSWNVTPLFLSADCWFLSLFTYLLKPWVLLIPFLFSPSQRIFLCKRETLFCIHCILWSCILQKKGLPHWELQAHRRFRAGAGSSLMNFPLCLDQRPYLSQTAPSVMIHHNLCLDENSMGISTEYKQGVSRDWQLVSSDTAVSSYSWTVSVSKGWRDTGYICHQSSIVSRTWASFFILKTVKEPGSACQSCTWWQSTSHMLNGLWVPPPSSHLHVFVIERTKEPASKIFINQVKMTQIVVTVTGS